MKVIVVGCGRVGSAIAKQLDREGWDVVAVDEKEEALSRLGEQWGGGFVVGHGMDVAVLRQAGIEDAVVRVLDPARADFYASRGLRTVCPTSKAIEVLTEQVRACEPGHARQTV